MSNIAERKIEELLRELRSEEAYRRERAATALAKLGVQDERAISVLENMAAQDPNEYVRVVARNTLSILEQAPSTDETIPLARQNQTVYKSLPREFWEFCFGFLGWFLIFGLIYSINPNWFGVLAIFGLMVFAAPVLLIILFLNDRLLIFLGGLAAYILNIFLSAGMGIFVYGNLIGLGMGLLSGLMGVPFFSSVSGDI